MRANLLNDDVCEIGRCHDEVEAAVAGHFAQEERAHVAARQSAHVRRPHCDAPLLLLEPQSTHVVASSHHTNCRQSMCLVRPVNKSVDIKTILEIALCSILYNVRSKSSKNFKNVTFKIK